MMETQILCSTGTLVGRANGYDYHVIIENRNAVAADGFELMMLKAWYDKLPEVADALERAGVKTPTIHFEKDVGALLSLGSEEDKEEGLRLFTLNADMAKAVGAEKAVFHLWDGRFSEAQLAGAISRLDALYEICDKRGVRLAVENVPCRKPTPLENILSISRAFPEAGFTFDTRHASYMDQCGAFFESENWESRICHLHVSDYSGETVPGMWGVTRPILHPGDGIIDFETLFAEMPAYHGGTVTLESPVLAADGGLDLPKLNRSLAYLSEKMKNH